MDDPRRDLAPPCCLCRLRPRGPRSRFAAIARDRSRPLTRSWRSPGERGRARRSRRGWDHGVLAAVAPCWRRWTSTAAG